MTLLDEEPVAPEKGPPDFLFICCGQCWQPKNAAAPVISRVDYERDAMRHQTFTCIPCSHTNQRQTDVFPALVGIWFSDMLVVREGSYAPDAETLFMPGRWGLGPQNVAMAAPERGNV